MIKISSFYHHIKPSFIKIIISFALGLALGFIVLVTSPRLSLGIIIGIPILIAIAHKPELGILGIVLIASGLIDAGILPLITLGPISFHITDALLLFILTIILIEALLDSNFKLVRTPLDALVLLFYLSVLLSALMAIFQPSIDTKWVFRQLRIPTYYLGFFCVTNLIRTKKSLQFLINGLYGIALIGSLAMILHAIFPSLQLIDTKSMELVTAGQEYAGVDRQYLQADRLIYPMLLISICSLALKGRLAPPILETGRIAILSMGLFLTFQRNYWITFLLMLALMTWLIRGYGRFRLLGLGILAISMVLLVSSLPEKPLDKYLTAASNRLIRGMQPQTLQQDGSTQFRIMETSYAVQSILDHPILGIGLGNFYRPAVRSDTIPGVFGLRWYNHNAYLWVLIDMGVVGFIPFILLYAVPLARGFKYWRKVPDPKWSAVLLGSTLGIFGQAISNNVAPNFIQTWMLIVFVILMGVNELIIHWEINPNQVLEQNR